MTFKADSLVATNRRNNPGQDKIASKFGQILYIEIVDHTIEPELLILKFRCTRLFRLVLQSTLQSDDIPRRCEGKYLFPTAIRHHLNHSGFNGFMFLSSTLDYITATNQTSLRRSSALEQFCSDGYFHFYNACRGVSPVRVKSTINYRL